MLLAHDQGPAIWVDPSLITADIYLIRSCCFAGMGIGRIPSVELPDPGIPEDLLVPVLPTLMGRERVLRASVPEALSERPKLKQVLVHLYHVLDPL